MRKDIVISALITLFTILILSRCQQHQTPIEINQEAAHEVAVVPEIKYEYGLPVDSFTVERGQIARNQNLSTLLMDYGVTAKTIDQIDRQKESFDIRQMRSGQPYTLFCSKDSLKTPLFFVYEHTTIEYVMIHLTDLVTVTVFQKPTTIEKKIASGIIHSNLWDAMVENHVNPIMSIELSEIYAWSIDFFGLQKGDQFFVIYDERMLDTVSVGVERIYAALFNHQNKDFYAIYFVQDEKESYFDEEGNSLRRSFLKAPLRYSHISSRYSNSRYHPILKIRRPHHGVDYAAPSGTPVYSVGDGVVVGKGYQKYGAGNYVKIKHNSVYTTQYAHLRNFAKGLSVGDRVAQGQLIGNVGKTGLATGPHLDFRFFKNGEPVDPLRVDAPPVEPIKKMNREEFEKVKNEFMKMLKSQRELYLKAVEKEE